MTGESSQAEPVLRLLVELPSRREVFFENLRELISPRRLPRLEMESAPAAFWPDVFVKRGLPWRRFVESGAWHVAAFTLLVELTQFFALQPKVIAKPEFDHTQVVYYETAEYLPPLDTRRAQSARAEKADPEHSKQPIISVPAEADNRSQTIVAPPRVKLTHEVAMPNIVAWGDKMERPQLEIPEAPLTPAAEITRIAPQMERAVVTPAPDADRLTKRRDVPVLENSVVAPPPSVEMASGRPVGEMNIGRSSVIAPAPLLAADEQRTVAGRLSGVTAEVEVVPPPPSIAGGRAAGGPGRVIALNLHPAVGAPVDPPAGNRRGTFAATPEGRAGAAGAPGSSGSGDGGGSGSNREGGGELPAGLYVGSGTGAKRSPIAGDPKAGANSVNPNLFASARWPQGGGPRSIQTESTAKLMPVELAVFGDRRFYSLILNMPNLNSGGGSWVIRFAEIGQPTRAQGAGISSSRDGGAGNLAGGSGSPGNAGSGNAPAENGAPNSGGGELVAPVATRKVDPAYPLQLMRENVSGTVILYAVIHADGTVGDVRVLQSVDSRIDRFAMQAVEQWRFTPARKNGVPVEVEATFQIPFRPRLKSLE